LSVKIHDANWQGCIALFANGLIFGELTLRVLYIGSFWMSENDIVSLMLNGLRRISGIDVMHLDPGIYMADKSIRQKWINTQGAINWLRDEPLSALVDDYLPDVVICSAGGFSPSPAMHEMLKDKGISTVGIALSDPDDFEPRSMHFSKYFDLFFTNAKLSLAQYSGVGVNAQLLPFAADAEFHKPLALKEKYDVVVLGGARPDRVEVVKELIASGIRVGCYGAGWVDHLSILRYMTPSFPKFARRIGKLFDHFYEAHGANHNLALNSGLMYLSFSMTMAGYANVKVGLFEAASAGRCIFVEDSPELRSYFEVGKEILTYDTSKNLIEKIDDLKKNLSAARDIGFKARDRILAGHKWEDRWRTIFKLLKQNK
jgi:hypothetical protein